MTFRDAMDAAGIKGEDAAELFGLTYQTIRQMRMSSKTAGFRSPPENWQRILSKWIRQKNRALSRLADQLEREAG